MDYWEYQQMINGQPGSQPAPNPVAPPAPVISQAPGGTGPAAGTVAATPTVAPYFSEFAQGQQLGHHEFYDDPELQGLKNTREDLAKGYNGQELGAIRSQARANIAGERQQGINQLHSNLAKSGVGGARGAAMESAADQGYAGKGAQAEAGMAKDQSAMVRQGQGDLQDFVFRQKYGELGTGAGMAQLGVAERTGARQAAAAGSDSGSGGICCFIFLEARYGNGTMDKVVRKFRDENLSEHNLRGYHKLSEVLVPLMRKSKLAKLAVRVLMTDPLVSYGKWHYGEGKIGWVFSPVKNFWLKAFEYLGQDHKYIRENGEVI